MFEKLVAEIMKECEAEGEPVTKEEAEEMARMELASKDNRRYETSDEPKKTPKTRERKVDEDKKQLLSYINIILQGGMKTENNKMKNEAELSFFYKENSYTIKLIKHRKKT